jgi:NADH-quinone oxidoreductase subunit L
MVTHAFFKALLFLGAGSVMHAMGNVIDMRRFGGLRRALPITRWTFLVGSAALAGFPLLAGFWSKDEILSVLKSAALHDGPRATWFAAVLAVALLTSLLTAFYTFRAYFLVFHGPERFPEEAGHHPHEAPPVMAVPLRILAVFAAGIGLVLGPTHLYSRYLSHVPGFPHAAPHGPDWLMMGVSSVLALAGVGGAWFCYVAKPELAASLRRGSGRLHGFLQDGLGFDALWQGIVVAPLRVVARFCEAFDRIVVDGLVDAVGQIPALFASVLRPLQDGLVPSYAWIMLAGLTALVLAAL